jgi:uncharacterized protein YcfL
MTGKSAEVSVINRPTADVVIENEYVKAVFSQTTNRLSSITLKSTAQTVQVDQNYYWYNASTGDY